MNERPLRKQRGPSLGIKILGVDKSSSAQEEPTKRKRERPTPSVKEDECGGFRGSKDRGKSSFIKAAEGGRAF